MRSVNEFARAKGLSPSRVRALIASGEIEARRVGHMWVIDDSALRWEPSLSRPLTPENAWTLIRAIDRGGLPSDLTGVRKQRLLARIAQLRESPDPATLLRSWLSRRAHINDFQAAPGALHYLRNDPRLARSGISDARSFMSAQSELEGYVLRSDLDALVDDHYLARGDRNNVRLHVVDDKLPEIGPGLVAADLADWRRPRESGRAAELIREVLGP